MFSVLGSETIPIIKMFPVHWGKYTSSQSQSVWYLHFGNIYKMWWKLVGEVLRLEWALREGIWRKERWPIWSLKDWQESVESLKCIVVSDIYKIGSIWISVLPITGYVTLQVVLGVCCTKVSAQGWKPAWVTVKTIQSSTY